MSKIVVLSETNCIKFLRSRGFKPSEFYTDIELFHKKSMYFSDTIVVILYSGACSFPQRKLEDMCKTLYARASSGDSGIKDLIIISDQILPHHKDYFLYRNNPLHCIRHSGWKATSGVFNLVNLDYDKSEVTDTYLTSSDYGMNEEALSRVRCKNQTEEDLISLIKVPAFK